jgi:hypothetical protein
MLLPHQNLNLTYFLGFDVAITNACINLKFLGSDAAFIFKELRYLKSDT